MKLQEIKRNLRDLIPEFVIKVTPIYTLLEWYWTVKENKRVEPYIPDEKDISTTIKHLINGLNRNCLSIETGGLQVYHTKPTEFDDGEYGIRFLVNSHKVY